MHGSAGIPKTFAPFNWPQSCSGSGTACKRNTIFALPRWPTQISQPGAFGSPPQYSCPSQHHLFPTMGIHALDVGMDATNGFRCHSLQCVPGKPSAFHDSAKPSACRSTRSHLYDPNVNLSPANCYGQKHFTVLKMMQVMSRSSIHRDTLLFLSRPERVVFRRVAVEKPQRSYPSFRSF